VETKKRTLVKTALWRILATMNSYLILTVGLEENIQSAILMNISGFFVYFLYERVANKISWGKVE